MSRRLVALTSIAMIVLGGVRPARVDAQTVLTGTTTTVKAGSGDQIDPHADCNLVSYSDDIDGVTEVRYFDFDTGADTVVVLPGQSFLSDVSGTRIALTNVTSAGSHIVVFDTATNSSFTIPGGNQRTNASIGGDLVAFEDRGVSTDPTASEIVVYNLATNQLTRLTTDMLMDTDPAVSPAGDAVVFTKCLPGGTGCDVYVSRMTAPDVFVTTPLTGAAGEEFKPATNGAVVVYAATRGGETDIVYQPIGGGPETRIDLPGVQRNPSVSGNLIAFESEMPDGNFDILVHDISSGTLYRATQTPVDETLNDITVCNGIGRLVYSAPGPSGDFDVSAFTFSLPSAVTAFANFWAAVDVDRGRRSNDDQLRLLGVFTLGATSDGIAPLTEDVTVEVESYTVTIPAGSFRRDRFGVYRFEGVVNGDPVQMTIVALGERRWAFTVAAQQLDLPAMTSPLTVSLRIGNDAATTEAPATIH